MDGDLDFGTTTGKNKRTFNSQRDYERPLNRRYCEERQCSVYRPLAEMTRLPDGSWRCGDHSGDLPTRS